MFLRQIVLSLVVSVVSALRHQAKTRIILQNLFGHEKSKMDNIEAPAQNTDNTTQSIWMPGDFRKNMDVLEGRCRRTGICHCPTTEMALMFTVPFADKAFLRNHDIYEFGVYTGKGINTKLKYLSASDAGPRHVWGFDSFEGLPKTKDNPMESALDVRNVQDFSSNWLDLKRQVLQNIDYENTTLIKGFYNESLNEHTVSTYGMKPAWWVNIDCDLYISAFQALDWMFKNRLVRSGTYVYYDDVLLSPVGSAEMKAHDEITQKYKVVWNKVLEHTHFTENRSVPYLFQLVSYDFLTSGLRMANAKNHLK